MAEHERIEALHRRLSEERRKVVEGASETGLVPPKSLLAYLADLDAATLAVEAVLNDWIKPTPRVRDAR